MNNEEYIKKFDEWNEYVKRLDTRDPPKRFSAREVWWCSMGVNVGSEIDGKNEAFERPVLILSRINKDIILVAPLTTKVYDLVGRIPVRILNNDSQILLFQVRVISSKRITRKIQEISKSQYNIVLMSIILYLLKSLIKSETPQK